MSANHIRARIGAKTGLLNYIHTPDETADFVREIAVLLDAGATKRLSDKLARSPAKLWCDVASTAYRGVPKDALCFPDALQAIIRRCKAHRVRVVTDLVPALTAIQAGETTNWEWIVQRLIEFEVEVSNWDLCAFVTHLAETDIPGIRPFLEYTDFSIEVEP